MEESFTNHYNETVKIIKYTGYKNVDVKFEDGTIIKTRIDILKNGGFRNPNNIYSNNKVHKIGEEVISADGEKAKVIKVVSGKAFIKFSDNTERAFLLKKIESGIFYKNKYAQNTKNRTGELKKIGKYTYKIISYNNSGDVSFKCLDTGEIFLHRNYRSFSHSSIKHNKYAKGDIKEFVNGDIYEIVEVKSRNVIVKKVNAQENKNIEIRKAIWAAGKMPQKLKYNYESLLNKKIKQKNGLCGKLKKIYCSRKMEFEFEDGTMVTTAGDDFINHNVLHPTFSLVKHFKYNNINAVKALVTTNNTFYKCQCQKCNFTGILTPQQMMAHQC